jgi:hypothetical protein
LVGCSSGCPRGASVPLCSSWAWVWGGALVWCSSGCPRRASRQRTIWLTLLMRRSIPRLMSCCLRFLCPNVDPRRLRCLPPVLVRSGPGFLRFRRPLAPASSRRALPCFALRFSLVLWGRFGVFRPVVPCSACAYVWPPSLAEWCWRPCWGFGGLLQVVGQPAFVLQRRWRSCTGRRDCIRRWGRGCIAEVVSCPPVAAGRGLRSGQAGHWLRPRWLSVRRPGQAEQKLRSSWASARRPGRAEQESARRPGQAGRKPGPWWASARRPGRAGQELGPLWASARRPGQAEQELRP